MTGKSETSAKRKIKLHAIVVVGVRGDGNAEVQAQGGHRLPSGGCRSRSCRYSRRRQNPTRRCLRILRRKRLRGGGDQRLRTCIRCCPWHSFCRRWADRWGDVGAIGIGQGAGTVGIGLCDQAFFILRADFAEFEAAERTGAAEEKPVEVGNKCAVAVFIDDAGSPDEGDDLIEGFEGVVILGGAEFYTVVIGFAGKGAAGQLG